MPKTRAVCRVLVSVLIVNFLLFGVKLYIGLASNSISIFSDSVNNLFDALSLLLTFAVLRGMLSAADPNTADLLQRTEQLLSFLISAAVVFTGLYFAYSALERFMYPAPVWYTPLYLGALIVSAAVKLGLFWALRAANRRRSSQVLGTVSLDSLLDFFITVFTVLTLLLSGAGHFSFDALFGLVISAAITVSGVKILLRAASSLIGYVPGDTRRQVNALLSEAGAPIRYVKYLRTGGKVECFAYLSAPYEDAAALAARIKQKTDVPLFCVADQESNTDHI
jgi:cation diffusion facilitator family transporter